MISCTFYGAYYNVENVVKNQETFTLAKKKENKVYDITEWREILNSRPYMVSASQYGTDIYEVVQAMKYNLTNRVMTVDQCRGLRDMTILGLRTLNREQQMGLQQKQLDTLLYGNRCIDIYNTQVLDASAKVFQTNRFETNIYVNNIKKMHQDKTLTYNDVFKIEFVDKFYNTYMKYCKQFEAYLSSDFAIKVVKNPNPKYDKSKGVTFSNPQYIYSLELRNRQSDAVIDIFNDKSLSTQDYTILLTLHLFMYPDVAHRTFFIDCANLNSKLQDLLIKFAKEPVFQPITVILY